jgi:hypothetical protein
MANNRGQQDEAADGQASVRKAVAQPIRIDEIYSLAEFQRRTGLKRAGIRSARRRGLRICKAGRNRYVSGLDWAEFLKGSPV